MAFPTNHCTNLNTNRILNEENKTVASITCFTEYHTPMGIFSETSDTFTISQLPTYYMVFSELQTRVSLIAPGSFEQLSMTKEFIVVVVKTKGPQRPNSYH